VPVTIVEPFSPDLETQRATERMRSAGTRIAQVSIGDLLCPDPESLRVDEWPPTRTSCSDGRRPVVSRSRHQRANGRARSAGH
jgi:hypothetical protein